MPSPRRPLRIAVLASGRGSNLQALIDARAAGRLPIELVGLFSDKPAAPVLERARAAGIPALVLASRDFADRAAHDRALFDAVAAARPHLVVCAGYMRIISDDSVHRFAGRMINIHPSLLPKYTGLHTHARALEAGDREHGASVHYVTSALDAGPVIAQARIPVLPGDTPDSLARRLLTREHPLLVACVALIAAGEVAMADGHVMFKGRPLASPLKLDEDDCLAEDPT